MRLIITRPLERALPLSEKLKEEGHEIFLAPVLKIQTCPFSKPEEPLQAVIFTSVQGVEAVVEQGSFQIFPAFTVGSKTAGAARQADFETIYNADGNIDDLYNLILERANPGKGLLLHLTGEQPAGKLVERLKEKNYRAARERVYEALAADSLSAQIVEKIRKKAFDGVLFYSPRTAAIFTRIILETALEGCFKNAVAFCLSENIAEKAEELAWKEIALPENPNEASMIALLQRFRK